MSAKPAPDSLDVDGRGAKLWAEVTAVYELRPDELVLLGEVCDMVNRIVELSDAVDLEGVVVEGSRGQPVIHPALVEQRQHRDVLRRGLTFLGLPDDPASGRGNGRSVQARDAAHARWRRDA